jgi:predicted nucleotidyltransferase
MLKNKVIEYITVNLKNFNSFDNVYLFGSVLSEDLYPKDIDLLLVYSQYSNQLLNNIHLIRSILQNEFNEPIDLTVLSSKELEETDFLRRIKQYYQIK